ncbi:MAG: hypothetical protein WBG90_05090 [Saonia sp.]
MSKIKTFEEACEALKLDPENVVPDFSMFPEKHQKAMSAHAKLIIIAEALNEGWQPDWGNGKWDKYFPWFNMGGSSGSGFSYHACGRGHSTSYCGSRLCFKSSELAKYAGNQFLHLYKDYYLM